MVHSIMNGKSTNPVTLGREKEDDAGEGDEGEDRRKHRHLTTISPKITDKGKTDGDSKEALIKKIMDENAKLAEELNKKG